MTSPVFHQFPLIINRTLTCIHCNSNNCERYLYGLEEGNYIFCSSCDQWWPDAADNSFEQLERERDHFWDGAYSEVIKTALESFTTINSFGKKKINYKKFISELLEFFEDNCKMLEDYEIQKLDLTFSINNEGVDLIDYYLHDFENDLKDLPM